jgi:photosystem II stability/assembly factor-like uncharacterized protein
MLRFHSFLRILFVIVVTVALGSGIVRAQYWVPVNSGLTEQIGSLAIAPNGDMYAGSVLNHQPTGVWRSTDNGKTWTINPTAKNSSNDIVTLGPVMGINPKGFSPNGDIFCIGGYVEFRSTDDGNSWQEIRMEPSLGSDPSYSAFAVLPAGTMGRLFIATSSTGLYVSDQDGASSSWGDEGDLFDASHPTYVASTPWGAIFEASATGLQRGKGQNADFFDSTFVGSPILAEGIAIASNATGLIVAGGTGGLYFSIDTGSYWSQITPSWAVPNKTYYTLAVSSNGEIFLGTNSTDGRTGGISVSRDTGRTWQDISSGLAKDTINVLAFNSNGALFAATYNGVFKFNPTGGVNNIGNDVASSLTLAQNSPNPVSVSTTIHFTVPESGPVSLKVFDVTGREMATVASGFYSLGTYNVSLAADNLPNGAYYYRLESGGQSASRMFVVEH